LKPLTILVLPGWYPTSREPLAGPFVRDHARAAATAGHNVVVLVDEGPRRGLRGLFELPESRDGQLRIVRFDHRPHTGRVAHLPAVLALARKLASKGTPVDVIHAHIHWMGWPAVLAGAILRRPVIISENSTEWPDHAISPRALWEARVAFRRAALVCPVNERLQQAIESYGLHPRFRIVPNTVDADIFHPAPEPAPATATRLINVALHVERKGLDVLVKAFSQLLAERPGLTLDLVGEGPSTLALTSLAAELGVAASVRFRGPLTASEIADALRDSHVFAFASYSENMPLAVIEALCCGLPVAATNVGGIPEAVGTDGILASPGNADALAAAIRHVLTRYSSFDRREIGARAAARFSFEAVGGVWDEIYRSL
jgi:glycosyltransferase involved in cell wall biosynthesis